MGLVSVCVLVRVCPSGVVPVGKLKGDREMRIVQFNHGFHDATMDASLGWVDRRSVTKPGVVGHVYRAPLPKGSKYALYRAGYAAGYESFRELGYRLESSYAAWVASGRK